MLYLVTTEGIDDGCWWDEPTGWNSLSEAREAAAKMADPPEGYCRCIYQCDRPIVVSVTNKMARGDA